MPIKKIKINGRSTYYCPNVKNKCLFKDIFTLNKVKLYLLAIKNLYFYVNIYYRGDMSMSDNTYKILGIIYIAVIVILIILVLILLKHNKKNIMKFYLV